MSQSRGLRPPCLAHPSSFRLHPSKKKLGSHWGSRATFGLVKRSSFCKGSYFAVDPLREGGCPSRQPVDCHQAFPPRWLLLSKLTRPPPLLNKANPLRPARQVRPLRGLFVRRATFARPTSVSLTIRWRLTSPIWQSLGFFRQRKLTQLKPTDRCPWGIGVTRRLSQGDTTIAGQVRSFRAKKREQIA